MIYFDDYDIIIKNRIKSQLILVCKITIKMIAYLKEINKYELFYCKAVVAEIISQTCNFYFIKLFIMHY